MPINLEEEKLAHEGREQAARSNNVLLGASLGRRGIDDDSVSESLKTLHPYAQPLTIQDVDSCVALENVTFVPEVRASRGKFTYRLSKASGISLGLFTSVCNGEGVDAPTAVTANATDLSFPERKSVLLAHVVATKSRNATVQDIDMAIPMVASEVGHVGHVEDGRTIAVHSLAVLPAFQRRGIGNMVMKAYIQRVAQIESVDRISILTYERLVEFYEKLGFENRGQATSQHGGQVWIDMVLEFPKFCKEFDRGEA